MCIGTRIEQQDIGLRPSLLNPIDHFPFVIGLPAIDGMSRLCGFLLQPLINVKEGCMPIQMPFP
jgi:hypothetical protein